jgi:hypothetical protein
VDVEHPGRPHGRLPRRRIDRVVDLASWALTCVALLVAVTALAAGRGALADTGERLRADTAERIHVRVVLLADAVPMPAADGPLPVPPVPTAARWVDDGGHAHDVVVPVRGHRLAGEEVAAWVDAAGPPGPPPAGAAAPLVAAGTAAGAVLLVGWGLLAAAWLGVRRWSAARSADYWEREWTRVEPEWTGRPPR